MNSVQTIEKSIIKTYRKELWSRFIKAVREYKLVQENDRIAVCISGGKDSMLMAKCFQELRRHSPIAFEVVYLVMDPGYSPSNRQQIEENLSKLQIDAEIVPSNIFEVTDQIEGNPCYLCARMRRGCLYSMAQARGCNKIALGHHFDDVVETILMSLFYGAEFKTMMPKLHSTNYSNMELIRPMYLIHEKDIIRWRDHNHLTFLNCACRLTEHLDVMDSKRKEMKEVIRRYKEMNPNFDINIFRSVESVNLNTILGYKQDGIVHNFLDDYDSME